MPEEPREEDRPFSSTEVGALIESFRNDVSAIGEEVSGFGIWRVKIDSRLESIETRLTSVEDAIRVGVAPLIKRVAGLEPRVTRLESKAGR